MVHSLWIFWWGGGNSCYCSQCAGDEATDTNSRDSIRVFHSKQSDLSEDATYLPAEVAERTSSSDHMIMSFTESPRVLSKVRHNCRSLHQANQGEQLKLAFRGGHDYGFQPMSMFCRCHVGNLCLSSCDLVVLCCLIYLCLLGLYWLRLLQTLPYLAAFGIQQLQFLLLLLRVVVSTETAGLFVVFCAHFGTILIICCGSCSVAHGVKALLMSRCICKDCPRQKKHGWTWTHNTREVQECLRNTKVCIFYWLFRLSKKPFSRFQRLVFQSPSITWYHLYVCTDRLRVWNIECPRWPLPHLPQFQSDAFSRLFAYKHLTGAGAAKTGPWSSAVAGKSDNSLPLVFSRVERLWRTGRLHSLPEGGGDQGTQTWDAHIHTITSKQIKAHQINFLSDVRVQEKGYDLLVHDFRTKEQTHSDNVDRQGGARLGARNLKSMSCMPSMLGCAARMREGFEEATCFTWILDDFGGGLSIHLFSGYPEVGQETSKCRKRVSILVESGETCLHALSAQHHSPRTVQPKQV